MTPINITENTLAAWTILEHIRTAKRWNEIDREWISVSQDLARQSLVALTGEERALKMISTARIALRKRQDELKQQRAEAALDEIQTTHDKITTDPVIEYEIGRNK